MNKPKILLFDIETMAGLGWFWERHETNILSVKHDWYIISFAYKWLHEQTVHVYALPDFPLYKRNKKNDRDLCQKLWEVLNESDIAIAHYGDVFDLKKANARFVAHGFKPIPPLKSIDTRKVAVKYFNFGSNRLNDLGKYLNIGEKHATGGWQLWLDCAEYDKKEAWEKMKLYNKQDVVLLEKVYLKLRPWIQRHPNINYFHKQIEKSSDLCPTCGQAELVRRGFTITLKAKYQKYQCMSCHAWTSDLTLKTKPKNGEIK